MCLLWCPFPLRFWAIATGVNTRTSWTKGRGDLKVPPNQAQDRSCALERQWKDFKVKLPYLSKILLRILKPSSPSNLIPSPSYRWWSWGTERLSHFFRVAQDMVADLGFTLQEPGSRYNHRLLFYHLEMHGQDFSFKVSSPRADFFWNNFELGQVNSCFWVSVSSSVKWGDITYVTRPTGW